jgi:hypothetical protein
MALFDGIARLVTSMIWRRRLHWVEISVAHAWSKDMAPRLFDLGSP